MQANTDQLIEPAAAEAGGETYLSKRALALRSGLSESTIQRYKDDGLIPYFQPGGKGARILFPADAIEISVHINRLQPPAVAASGFRSPPVFTSSPQKKLPGPQPRWLSIKNKKGS